MATIEKINDGYFFLTKEACEALPKYKYKGEDRSLLYIYVLSPLAAFLVNTATPRWLAPNAITLIGLVWMGVAYATIWYYVPTLEIEDSDSVPRWIFLLNFVSMLVYQTLDNMDGKQARRTGSSSPLGMLFDHGCDAINAIAGSANWIMTLGLNPDKDALLCWAIVLGPMSMFFIATWEEFYTGALILPIINGVSEGLVGGALLSLATYLYGVEFWQDTHFYNTVVSNFLPGFVRDQWIAPEGLRNADLQVMLALFFIVREYIDRSIVISYKFGLQTLWNQIAFLVLASTTLAVGVADRNVWLRMPRTSLHLSSVLFVDLVTQLMLDHLTKQPYNPFRWIQAPMVGLTLLVAAGMVEASSTTDSFLLAYTTGLWVYQLLKIRIVIHEACAVLGIWCFNITTPRTTSKKLQ